jgi:hypothetical protein
MDVGRATFFGSLIGGIALILAPIVALIYKRYSKKDEEIARHEPDADKRTVIFTSNNDSGVTYPAHIKPIIVNQSDVDQVKLKEKIEQSMDCAPSVELIS